MYMSRYILHSNMYKLGFFNGSVSKESACNLEDTGDTGLIPGSGRSPEEGIGNPLQYSCLGNPVVRGTWWPTSPWGPKRVGHN